MPIGVNTPVVAGAAKSICKTGKLGGGMVTARASSTTIRGSTTLGTVSSRVMFPTSCEALSMRPASIVPRTLSSSVALAEATSTSSTTSTKADEGSTSDSSSVCSCLPASSVARFVALASTSSMSGTVSSCSSFASSSVLSSVSPPKSYCESIGGASSGPAYRSS